MGASMSKSYVGVVDVAGPHPNPPPEGEGETISHHGMYPRPTAPTFTCNRLLDSFPLWGKAGMGAGMSKSYVGVVDVAGPHPSPPPVGEGETVSLRR
ncbi:hypothetical protein GCM10022279_09480 [Comamonas faecalis]|uniref:Uncharacterized protein n=1 Tax=Comamonas faecalis TaxID=1387849 RepID=A0ABP7QVT0_9BURK